MLGPLGDAGPPSYKDIGFDLDNTCTGEGQGSSCVEPPWATGDHSDGVDGVDNAWGPVLNGGLVVDVNTPIMVFRVSSYSGQPDDDQVEVSLYIGLGLSSRSRDGDGGSTPLWDGNDRWNVVPEMLAPSTPPHVDEPLYRDNQAYVSGGVLVAHFPMTLWSPGNFMTPRLLLPATDVVLAGSLTHVGALWELQDAIVDMRVRFNDMLMSFAQLPNSVGSGIVCQNDADYEKARQAVCPVVDIASSPGPSSAPCDAISAAGMFEAKQAQLGDVLPPSQPPALNCAQGINPATDTCEPRD